jgi:hypothetical protein
MKKSVSGLPVFLVIILSTLVAGDFPVLGQTPVGNEGKTMPIVRPRRENPRAAIKTEEDPTDNLMIGFRPLSNIRKEIKEKLKLTDDDKDNYRLAAGDKKANITRILSAFSCSTSLIVDVSDPRCSENPDFFVGSYYSFRFKDYGESPWTDVGLIEDEITAGNKWHTIGYLIDLGDGVEFGKLDSRSEEIKSLWEFQQPETMQENAKQKADLESGFSSGKLFLTKKVKAQANHVYMLRTISFRLEGDGYFMRAGFNWHNTDSLFVFKILEMDTDKTLTVAWKRIFQKVAPILEDKNKDK